MSNWASSNPVQRPMNTGQPISVPREGSRGFSMDGRGRMGQDLGQTIKINPAGSSSSGWGKDDGSWFRGSGSGTRQDSGDELDCLNPSSKTTTAKPPTKQVASTNFYTNKATQDQPSNWAAAAVTPQPLSNRGKKDYGKSIKAFLADEDRPEGLRRRMPGRESTKSIEVVVNDTDDEPQAPSRKQQPFPSLSLRSSRAQSVEVIDPNRPPATRTASKRQPPVSQKKTVGPKESLASFVHKSRTLAKPLDPSTTVELDDDDDQLKIHADDEVLTRGAARPFPLDVMSQLPSRRKPRRQSRIVTSDDEVMEELDREIEAGLRIPSSCSRRSSDESEGDRSPIRKSNLASNLSYSPLNTLNSNVDHAKLCPFCDEPWPTRPSETLQHLLAKVKRMAYPQPRAGNRLGLKAPMASYMSLCLLHRAETVHIPEGIRNGWPTEIDFAGIPNRLKRVEEELQEIVDSPDSGYFFEEQKRTIEERGAIFAESTAGQFASFARAHPGYYGERGIIVIRRALEELFPFIDQTAIYPLDPNIFRACVLLPEAALLLIQEDRRVPRSEALEIMRASVQYGNAMFPEAGAEVAGDDAAGHRFNVTVAKGSTVGKKGKGKRPAMIDADPTDTDVWEDEDAPTPPKKSRKAEGKRKAQGHSIQTPARTAILDLSCLTPSPQKLTPTFRSFLASPRNSSPLKTASKPKAKRKLNATVASKGVLHDQPKRPSTKISTVPKTMKQTTLDRAFSVDVDVSGWRPNDSKSVGKRVPSSPTRPVLQRIEQQAESMDMDSSDDELPDLGSINLLKPSKSTTLARSASGSQSFAAGSTKASASLTQRTGKTAHAPLGMRRNYNLPGVSDAADKSFKSVQPSLPIKRTRSPIKHSDQKRQRTSSSSPRHSTRVPSTDKNEPPSDVQEAPDPRIGWSSIEQRKKHYKWLLDFE